MIAGACHILQDKPGADAVLRMDPGAFQFNLSQGRAYVLNNASVRSVLQFDTPDASIRSFGVSTFGIDVPEGETDVSMFRGSVQLEDAEEVGTQIETVTAEHGSAGDVLQ